MFKELIQTFGLQTFSTIAMLFFIVFFLGILLRVFLLKKDFTKKMGNLPLEDETPQVPSPEDRP